MNFIYNEIVIYGMLLFKKKYLVLNNKRHSEFKKNRFSH